MSLELITSLAQRQIQLQRRIEELEEELKEAKEQLEIVSGTDIPEAMESAGVSEIKLADGRSVTIKRSIITYIKKENEESAFNWLRKNGYDSIIKREVSVKFGKGDDKVAQILHEYLISNFQDFEIKDKSSVHFQTLRAWAREMMSDGEELPDDIFSIVPKNETIIK